MYAYVTVVLPCVGICGTDAHIHDGEFISKFPVSQHDNVLLKNLRKGNVLSQLVPGHEVVGVVVEVGKNVREFQQGDRCVADNSDSVGQI